MFEDANFDFDDDAVLRTSFTPVSSSTQVSPAEKRHSEELEKENLKKPKLSSNESFIRNPSVSPHKKEKAPQISFNTPNRVVKRRFPGPAGLLPERTEGNKSILDFITDERCERIEDTRDQVLLCSQRTVSVFEDGPWKEMTKDFYVPNGECPYEKFNIRWIKRQSSLKRLLVNHKAPFLAAVIHLLEIFDGKVPTVNITLKDATGEIQGTVLHSLYEEYSNYFTIGSVLVLKHFGVLSAGYKNHCLTITPNNLVTIYCLETPKKMPSNSSDCEVWETDSCVKKIVIQKCTVDEIMRKYNEDVSAGESKQKVVNFGRLYKNHENLRKNSETNDQSSGLESKAVNRSCDDVVVGGIQSQLSVKTNNKEHSEIWKDLLEGVDADALFGDF